MRFRSSLIGFTLLGLVLSAAPAVAQLSASYTVSSFDYDGYAFDCDTCCSVVCGDTCPANCELYGGLAVWEGSEAPNVSYYEVTSDYNACNGVGSTSDTDGSYTFNRTVTTSLDNRRSSVQTMFLLYDDDPLGSGNKDDLLGSDHDLRSASGSWNESNDAQLPSGYTVLEGTCTNETANLENLSGLYSLSHSLSITDATGPEGIGIATPTDATAASGWDDDFILTWVWDKATDPHSGIGLREVDLWEGGSQVIVNVAPTCGPTTCSITACGPSAGSCQLVWDILEEETYHLQVAARNDDATTADISNRRWARICSGGTQDGQRCTDDSSSCRGGGGTCLAEIDSEPVMVDRTAPTTVFGSGTPFEGSWLRQGFSVYFDDFDINPLSCFYQAVVDGYGPDSGEWAARSCSGSATITVGPAPSNCSVEGHDSNDVCRIYSRVVDAAGNFDQTSRGFSIDFTPDQIATVNAYTGLAGSPITDGAWTADADPFLVWSPPTSTSPIVGYSWAIGAVDCIPDTTATSVNLSTSPLADGSHLFQVRSIDEAGNCGPASSFTLNVDTASDAIETLSASAESGGAPIGDGDWISDPDPFMSWSTPTSTAPISGYSWALGVADCEIDTEDTSEDFSTSPLTDGSYAFHVRSVDEAGNCGPASSFMLNVDTVADSVEAIRAYTEAGGVPISPDTPQPDDTPYVEWDPPASTAPVAGYSYELDAIPDCLVVETPMTFVNLGPLPEGTTTFGVRAVDEAGNCGGTSTFDLVVDHCPEVTIAGPDITSSQLVQGCTIFLGPDVTIFSEATLTLEAARWVAIGDGVSVESGAGLTIGIDPALTPP